MAAEGHERGVQGSSGSCPAPGASPAGVLRCRPRPRPALDNPSPHPAATAARQVLVEKCLGRRICSKCGKNYNVADIYLPASNGRPEIVMPPLNPPAECMKYMEQRSDDNEETIRKRLEVCERCACGGWGAGWACGFRWIKAGGAARRSSAMATGGDCWHVPRLAAQGCASKRALHPAPSHRPPPAVNSRRGPLPPARPAHVQVYKAAAAPVEDYYRAKGLLLDFEITGGIPETLPRLLETLEPYHKTLGTSCN